MLATIATMVITLGTGAAKAMGIFQADGPHHFQQASDKQDYPRT